MERARKLAACPKCGERSSQAKASYWASAGAIVGLPLTAAVVLAATAFSGSAFLALITVGAGAAISWFIFKRSALPK